MPYCILFRLVFGRYELFIFFLKICFYIIRVYKSWNVSNLVSFWSRGRPAEANAWRNLLYAQFKFACLLGNSHLPGVTFVQSCALTDIVEKEPLVNRFISSSEFRDDSGRSQLNCANFSAGLIEQFLRDVGLVLFRAFLFTCVVNRGDAISYSEPVERRALFHALVSIKALHFTLLCFAIHLAHWLNALLLLLAGVSCVRQVVRRQPGRGTFDCLRDRFHWTRSRTRSQS